MNETVKRIVDLLFDNTVDNEETRALHEEIMNNCQEHYTDLVSRGLSEDDAIHEVIVSLKGMEDVIAEFRLPPEKASVADELPSMMEFDTEGVRRVRIETLTEEIVVRTSPDGRFNFRYDGHKRTLDITREGETLRVGLKKLEIVPAAAEPQSYTWRDVFPQHENGGFSFDIRAFLGKMQSHVNVGTGEDATLTVELPADFGGTLQALTRSGDMDVSDLDVTELTMNSTGGSVEANMDPNRQLDHVTVNSTGGGITYYGNANQLTASGISSDVDIKGNFGSATVKTVSGDIEFRGTVASLRANSVSGDQTVRVGWTEAAEVRLESVSGDVDLMLPEEMKVDLTVHTTSGDADVDRESEPGAASKVWLKTVSGDIDVE